MSKILTQITFVFLGGGVGSCLRFALSHFLSSSMISLAFVNILGGIGAGFVMSSFPNDAVDCNMRVFLMTGLLGGFTTFSAFSYEVYQLIQKSHYLMATGFVICVFFGSILGVFFGHKL